MKTYTTEQLAEILGKHKSWLLGEDGGERANLRSADLRYANLRSADLRYADLRYADLRYADLRYANLRSADLRYADLRSADLRSANLSSSNLSYADLRSADSINGLIGNMSEVKSVQCDYWPVTYTAEKMQVGCQLHLITEWWEFSDSEISRMDSHAAAWWTIWKPILKTIIDASPATPIGIAEPKEQS